MSESTKKKVVKKTSSRSADKEKDREVEAQVSELEDESDISSSQRSEKKKSSRTTSSRSKAAKEATASQQENVIETQSEMSSSTMVSSTTVTSGSRTPSRISNGSAIGDAPVTPLSKFFGSSTSTPSSPGTRLSVTNRLREREELSELTRRVAILAAAVEEKNKEIASLQAEHGHHNRVTTAELHDLRTRLEQAETTASMEIKLRTELQMQLDRVLADLKNKEDSLMNERANSDRRLESMIGELTKEHTHQLTLLRTDLTKRISENEMLKNEVKMLSADLLTKGKEQDEKTRRLLQAEYDRLKHKEDDLRNTINLKESDIKKLRTDLKDKDKLISESLRKESELQQTVEAFERQKEDMRDSIDRDWELRIAQAVEEHNAKMVEMQVSVTNFDEERDSFRQQINVLFKQNEDMDLRNHELSDRIGDLSGQIANKDVTIHTLTTDIEDLKKHLHRYKAESKNKDNRISLLQDQMNTKELKYTSYHAEMSKMKQELYTVQSQNMEPDVPLTREIERLKEVVSNVEDSVFKRDRKRLRKTYESQESSDVESLENSEEQSLSSMGIANQSLEVNTMSIFSIDTSKGCIKLTVKGDFHEGLSITGWKLIVVKPNDEKFGFSFPDNIHPIKGIQLVHVLTGLSRPQNVQTPEYEFYWARQGLWDMPEGTTVKLVTPSNEIKGTIQLPASGIYIKDDAIKPEGNNCLIM
ncbi:hypothetical protein SAMD00019534_015410 [Acytostelium subglobosum LB1]|uniref:hypothetical protein n=1 Tax=Acytostelium subglobosum LB1 TaxID=1410327 RepID=UPI0006448F73|nr:hypothetical protein SAMD00019534_015410 [Acytostelium subglobosum LB1]GAM18366.1 hypothetical protein SAMD00019534_015410 [Acytostelium subglobosum LB1]|eukprot:XP_012757586.1 hypothetical protein SAMD00019534_015410 [Acytostelium subglobosum LB1]